MVSVIIFGGLLIPQSPGGLAGWLVIRLVVSAFAVMMLRRLASGSYGSDETIRILAWVMTVSGVAWGAIPLLIRPEQPEWRAVVVLWLFGNQAVVTAVCSPSKAVFRAACGSVTLVGAASMLLYGDGFSLILALILLLGGVYSLSIFSAMHQSVNSAITGRLTAAALATSLTERQFELQTANAALTRLASRDELTNLLNRRSFFESVVDESGVLQDDGWLIYLDLDHFKSVNDIHGHAAGDQVLQIAAKRWGRAVSTNGLLARTGGDEFTVWVPASGEDAVELGRKLNACLETPMAIAGGVSVEISCSLGITRVAAGETYVVAADRADRSLYRAKHEGRNRVEFAADRSALSDGSAPSDASALNNTVDQGDLIDPS